VTIREINQDDPDFFVHDNLKMAARAALIIHPECPKDYAMVIHQALARNYISLRSHVYDKELVWEELCK